MTTITEKNMMKAAVIKQYGTDVKITLAEVSKPSIQSNQVLIKIVATGVNPVDFHVRNGMLADSGTHTLPLILGWDAAGTIEEIGDDVDQFQLNDEVFTFTPIGEQGTYAEYIAVDASFVTAKPKSLSMIESAAVPLAALTAYQGLKNDAQLKAGQTVVILGGSGGVGGFAIQIAKAMGAHVITTASARNIDYVKQLGADEVINYKETEFDDVVKNPDAIFVTTNGDNVVARALSTVKKGGCVVSTLDDIDEASVESSGAHFSRMWVQNNGQDLSAVGDMIDQGKITVKLDSTYSLANANDALLKSESNRAVGKIVITINEAD